MVIHSVYLLDCTVVMSTVRTVFFSVLFTKSLLATMVLATYSGRLSDSLPVDRRV